MRILTACSLAILLAPCSQAADVAGYVLAVQGKWSLQGQPAELVVGAPVVQGASLVAASPVAGDHIVVVEFRSGAVLVARQCDTARACARPLVVPRQSEARAQGSPVARLLNGILARIAGDPDRYITTLSRGSARLVDAVLPWSEGGVELAPVLPVLPAGGEHAIALVTLQCRGPGACPQQPLMSHIGGRRTSGRRRCTGSPPDSTNSSSTDRAARSGPSAPLPGSCCCQRHNMPAQKKSTGPAQASRNVGARTSTPPPSRAFSVRCSRSSRAPERRLPAGSSPVQDCPLPSAGRGLKRCRSRSIGWRWRRNKLDASTPSTTARAANTA